MEPEKFIAQMESGHTVLFDDVEDFIKASKICRKRYGKKAFLPADSPPYKQCIVIIREDPEIVGAFRVSIGKIAEYCRNQKIKDWDEFCALYEGRHAVRKRQQDLRFMQAKDKWTSKYTTLFRKLGVKKREELIAKMEKM